MPAEIRPDHHRVNKYSTDDPPLLCSSCAREGVPEDGLGFPVFDEELDREEKTFFSLPSPLSLAALSPLRWVLFRSKQPSDKPRRGLNPSDTAPTSFPTGWGRFRGKLRAEGGIGRADWFERLNQKRQSRGEGNKKRPNV